MGNNMFYIKEKDQELFDQFSPVFVNYAKESVNFRDYESSYTDNQWYEFSLVFFVLFTRTRKDYYKNILRIIIDIYNGYSRDVIEEKYSGIVTNYVLDEIIYRSPGKNTASDIFFNSINGYIYSIYESGGNIININVAKWNFPYLYFYGVIKPEYQKCTINDFIGQRKTYGDTKPIFFKITRDFLSYFGYGTKSDLEYMTEEYKATKERINYLNNQLSTEKSKLNELESKIRRMQNRDYKNSEKTILMNKPRL